MAQGTRDGRLPIPQTVTTARLRVSVQRNSIAAIMALVDHMAITTMKLVDSFEFEVHEEPHVWVTMADGCRLSVRIWRPANALAQPVPAIIEHLPYRKRDGTIARDQLTHPWFAGHGYACIRVDMRGNGDSEGLMEDEYTAQEWSDACDVITWAADQPWCSGKVGMMGISWGGFNSLQVAALRPHALKAIITLCSTVDRFADDIHYKGGCMLTENIGWAATMLSYSSRPPDPDVVGNQWRELWLNRLENMPFLASTWMRHQRRDDYWKHGSICEDYAAIEAAVLAIGGWHDGYRNTISHLLTHLQAPVKGIVGPWIHKYPHYAAPEPTIGFLQEAKRWWDHWLKDIDTSVVDEPAYRVWLMDSIKPERWLPERPGRWIGEVQWPSPQIRWQTWQLGCPDECGVLSDNQQPQSVNKTVASDQHCGMASGEYFPFAFGPELPDEQSTDDAMSLVFDSKPLESTLELLGAPTLHLVVESDSPKALLCARLCELRPDGTSALITAGLVNLTHHASSEHPRLLTPGERIELTVPLDQIAFKIPQGHRLRLALSNCYWPFVWPSPTRTAIDVREGKLELPIRKVDAPILQSTVSFEEPEAAPPWQSVELRPAASTRETVTDPLTGVVTTMINNDFGERQDLEHGLVSGSQTRETWSIHPDDPLSATAHISWVQNGGRGPWRWNTDVEMTMHADEQHFYIDGKLQVNENGALLFERHYRDVIERQFI